MKTVQGAREQTRVSANKTKEKGLLKEKVLSLK